MLLVHVVPDDEHDDVQGQQPERPFSTPPSGSAEATDSAAAVELVRQLSLSAPPPGSYSDRLPSAAPVTSHQVCAWHAFRE